MPPDGGQRGEAPPRLVEREEVGLRREDELVPRERRSVFAHQLGRQALERLLHRRDVVDEERRLRRQVLEERSEPAGVEGREERLHPEEGGAGVDGVEQLPDP